MELPAPLTVANCDLRDFPFMPLEVSRLRRSKTWLISKRRPEIGFYSLNLWIASWHEVPAASLEDDDDVLADLAMCDPTRWAEMRADALRGWVKCSDGRLYHPIVAEKANEAFAAKLRQRQQTEAARNARAVARNAPKLSVSEIVAPPTVFVTDTVEASKPPEQTSKGQGEGQGQRENQAASPPELAAARPAPPPPADALLERAKDELGVSLASLRQNLDWINFPAKVCEWRRQGAIDADIWPTMKRLMAKKGELPRSPAYFAAAVLEAKDRRIAERAATQASAKAMADLPDDHPTQIGRLRHWRETGEWFDDWGRRPQEALRA